MTARRGTAWDAAIHIIRRLREHGHVALLAGGCVRDRLLGREPKDYDVATDATPTRVADIFPRVRRVGAKFGVMLVRKYNHDIEVATFRADGTYSDGRRPDQVVFGTELQDAQRRDFTINGLFLDPVADRVIDHVGGRADLQARLIRTIGDPHRRFAEDHLRMLRAIRFAARLDFTIDQATFSAIEHNSRNLQSISAERVWMELEAILTAPSREKGWDLLCRTGLRAYLASKWSADGRDDAAVRRRLALLPDEVIDPQLAMAAVLRSRGPTGAKDICAALRLSNRLANSVVWLVRSLPVVRDEQALELADLKMLMADENWDLLLELLHTDLRAEAADTTPYHLVVARAAAIAPADVAPRPLVDGDDLTAAGVPQGPSLGQLLTRLYRAQLNEEISTREQAMGIVRAQLDSGLR
ncbi:MAG: CCA tRNA nucleotidyltransferase [Phycisphaerae bacterium]